MQWFQLRSGYGYKSENTSEYITLKSYDKDVHPVGENLPENVRILRVKILTAFMSTGVKINRFREVFEETALRLTSSHNLRQLVPFVEHQELTSIKGLIKDKQVAAALPICLLRCISPAWMLQ